MEMLRTNLGCNLCNYAAARNRFRFGRLKTSESKSLFNWPLSIIPGVSRYNSSQTRFRRPLQVPTGGNLDYLNNIFLCVHKLPDIDLSCICIFANGECRVIAFASNWRDEGLQPSICCSFCFKSHWRSSLRLLC